MPEGKIRDQLNNMSLRKKSHSARGGKGGGKRVTNPNSSRTVAV